jgi:hypothetical protein
LDGVYSNVEDLRVVQSGMRTPENPRRLPPRVSASCQRRMLCRQSLVPKQNMMSVWRLSYERIETCGRSTLSCRSAAKCRPRTGKHTTNLALHKRNGALIPPVFTAMDALVDRWCSIASLAFAAYVSEFMSKLPSFEIRKAKAHRSLSFEVRSTVARCSANV